MAEPKTTVENSEGKSNGSDASTKPKLDEVRTLAIKLFEAGEAEKRKQPKHIWEGQTRTWRDLPSESVAVWDAVAICAYDQLKRTK